MDIVNVEEWLDEVEAQYIIMEKEEVDDECIRALNLLQSPPKWQYRTPNHRFVNYESEVNNNVDYSALASFLNQDKSFFTPWGHNQNHSNNNSVDYSALTSFLKPDNSFFSPWSRNQNHSNGNNVNYSALTSFLNQDDSFFSPWNWNQNHDQPQGPNGYQPVFQGDSFFSYDLFSSTRSDGDVEPTTCEFFYDCLDKKKKRKRSKKSKKKAAGLRSNDLKQLINLVFFGLFLWSISCFLFSC
ncbi:hypothetical protein M5689_000308 [Euphorbia peplus]|nr:hypothetical protein M5689_000308 [Euphorbia peplus]